MPFFAAVSIKLINAERVSFSMLLLNPFIMYLFSDDDWLLCTHTIGMAFRNHDCTMVAQIMADENVAQ